MQVLEPIFETERSRRYCISVPNFLVIGPTVAEIRQFFDFSRWQSPLPWILKFLKVLTVGRLKGLNCVALPNLVKIGQTAARYMAIFRFFKVAAAAILGLSNLKFLTVGRLKRVKLRCRAKFGRNRSNRGQDMVIFRFFKDGGRPPSWNGRHLGFLNF